LEYEVLGVSSELVSDTALASAAGDAAVEIWQAEYPS